MRKLTEALFPPLFLLSLAALLLHAAEAKDAAYFSMRLAAAVVVPSLFPFAALAALLVQTGRAARWGRRLGRPMERIFHVEGACAAPFLLGLLCGYPVGAAALAALVEKKQLSRESAERALAFSSCASPGFLYAVAGVSLLGSARAGLLLLLLQPLSAVLSGLLQRGPLPAARRDAPLPPAVSPVTALPAAIRSAAAAMVQLTGFLVFFSVALFLLRPLLALLPSLPAAVLSGLLEVTNGLTLAAALPAPLPLRFCLCAALLGFSGFCVHAQVLAYALPLGLRAGPYLRGKALQGLLSLLLSLPCTLLLDTPAVAPVLPAAAFSDFFGTAALFLLTLPFFFLCLWKSGQESGIMEKK